jgi:hypothetical protein
MEWATSDNPQQAPHAPSHVRHFLVDTPLQLEHSFSARTKFDARECKMVASTFTEAGDIVVSDAGNNKVKIFGLNGDLKVECSVPKSYSCGLLEPRGVAVLQSGEIVACDRRGGNLKVFTPEGKCLTTMNRTLLRPADIAVTSASALVVADEAKKDVVIFRSISDRKPVSLQSLNADRLDLQTPSNVCVTSTDQIVVFDSTSKRFLLFSKEGKLCCDNLIPKDLLSQFLKPKTKKQRAEKENPDWGHL